MGAGPSLPSPDWGEQGLAPRWPVPAGGPGAGKRMVEDCDASITPCLHPSSFTAQGCGESQRQGREGFPAKSGERSWLQGFTATAGKEVVRALGDSEPGWFVGRGSQGPPSDPAVETSPRPPHHPGACPCQSPTGGITPPAWSKWGQLAPPRAPPCRPQEAKDAAAPAMSFAPGALH